MQPLLQHRQQRKLSAAQISLGTGGQGAWLAADSASSWVLLKTQRFLLLFPTGASSFLTSPKNSLFLQGLNKKGAQLLCQLAAWPPFRLLFVSLSHAVSTDLPLRADAARCSQAQLPPPGSRKFCCPVCPPQPSLTTLGMHQQEFALNASLPGSVLLDATVLHSATTAVHPLGGL